MINSWGGKPAVEYEGRPVFAELAITRMVIKAGWSARWVEVYYLKDKEPYYLMDWNDAKPFKQTSVPLDSPYHLKLMSSIEKRCIARSYGSAKRRGGYAGAWDVLAWNGERTLFIESKRKGKDRISGNQVEWYSAALDAGQKHENFLVVQWKS
jgi:hypothetical protein